MLIYIRGGSGLVHNLVKELKEMSEALNRLRAEIEQNREVTAAAVAMISGISEQIRTAMEEDEASDEGALAELADDLDSQSAELAAAIAANTPAATETPVDTTSGMTPPAETTGGDAGAGDAGATTGEDTVGGETTGEDTTAGEAGTGEDTVA